MRPNNFLLHFANRKTYLCTQHPNFILKLKILTTRNKAVHKIYRWENNLYSCWRKKTISLSKFRKKMDIVYKDKKNKENENGQADMQPFTIQ